MSTFGAITHDMEAIKHSLVQRTQERAVEPAPWLVRAPRRLFEGVRTMRTAYRIAAIAVIVTIVGLITWLSPGDRGPGVAFADVMGKLQKARTADFTLPIRPRRKPATSMRVREVAGEKVNIETSQGDTYIIDYKARRGLALMHRLKKAFDCQWPADGQVGSLLPGSSLEEVRERLVVGGPKEEALGQKQMGDRLATGFRVRRADGVWTVWADAESGLILRLEWLSKTPEEVVEQVWSDFKFDVEFDDALFTLQPPAGYEVVTRQVPPPVMSPEKSVCRSNLQRIGLAFHVYLSDHAQEFPDSLDDLVKYLEGREALICPASGQEGYVYEKPAIPFAKTAVPAYVIIVYDKARNHEGGRNVLFLDGHVQWLTEEEFQSQLAESRGEK